jgi:hypothetical protein
MSTTDHPWADAGLDAALREALTQRLPPNELWSLLLTVLEARAARRSAAMVRQQWEHDRFVQPAAIDQRTLNHLDSHLLAAASDFEALELSPVAPLGSCASVALTSQNRIVSTARGTEVVSDPTNVLALECARRLRAAPDAVVKLATSHRCLRAQPVPKRPGFAQHFRMFCLASAGHEQKDHGFLTGALLEHIRTHIASLDRLEKNGYHFPDRNLRLLATPPRMHLAERMAAAITGIPVTVTRLEHGYYDGLRFMLEVSTPPGDVIPFIDGGAFDWLRKLLANDRMVFVASGMGSQIAAYLFRRVAMLA